MIKAKATRESAQASHQTRENYVHPEKPGGGFLPVAFLMALTGFAVYVKSFMPVRVEAAPERPTPKPTDDEPVAVDPEQQELKAEEAESDRTGSIADRAKGSGSPPDNVVPIPARFTLSPEVIDEFLANDSPAIDFNALQRGPGSSAGSGIGGPGHPSNDNQSKANAAGGSSGGGGGGGGSSDPGPKTPTPPELPRNRAPRTNGPVQLQDLIGCHSYLISILALLAGTTDPDGDQLALGNLSVSSGTLTPAEGGGWLYTPERGVLGDVTLAYYITDGLEIVQQSANFRVLEAPPVVGTDSDNNLIGTQCGEVVDGRGGDDNIDAKGGADLIIGGDGDDHILAGAGDDVVYAGAGNDVVFAGTGNDIIFGGAGNDRLFGEDGDDTVYADEGDDFIMGGEGADIVFAEAGNDTVHGDGGNDTLDGGTGHDVLHGGAGHDVMLAGTGNDVAFGDADNDTISDGTGEDEIHGGDGNDYVVATADAAPDSYSGDAGEDTLDYSSATLSITVDLGRGSAQGLEVGRDLISGFEQIIGGRGDDRFIAGSTSISMTGGGGNDTFEFGGADADYQLDLVRKITDFTIGDRVIVASYEVRYKEGEIDQAIGDLFDDIYLSNGSNARPVRFRFEKLDDNERTFIDVHQDNSPDDFYSIELFGRHHLEVTVAVS